MCNITLCVHTHTHNHNTSCHLCCILLTRKQVTDPAHANERGLHKGGRSARRQHPGATLQLVPHDSLQPKLILYLAYYLGISVFKFREQRNNWPGCSFASGYLTHSSLRLGGPPQGQSGPLTRGWGYPWWAWLGQAMTESLVQKVKWAMPSNVGPWGGHIRCTCKRHMKFYSSRLIEAKRFSLFSFAHSLYLRSREKELEERDPLKLDLVTF